MALNCLKKPTPTATELKVCLCNGKTETTVFVIGGMASWMPLHYIYHISQLSLAVL
jgi:hypothetical protein